MSDNEAHSLGTDSSTKSEGSVVGSSDDFLLGVEDKDAEYRTKYLLLHYSHVVCTLSEDSGGYVETFLRYRDTHYIIIVYWRLLEGDMAIQKSAIRELA